MLVDPALQDDGVFIVPGAYRHILTQAEEVHCRALGVVGTRADVGAEGEGGCHAPVWENVACDSTLSLAAHDDYGGSADM